MPRPTRRPRLRFLPTSQLVLRALVLLACLASLVVAIYVSINLHVQWYIAYASVSLHSLSPFAIHRFSWPCVDGSDLLGHCCDLYRYC
jgi:hypothetical protein